MHPSFLKSFFPYQRKWLEESSPFKIGLWARQTGKDFTCAAEAVLDCMLRREAHWLIVACGERQAIESLQKARAWTRKLDQCIRHASGKAACEPRESATEIVFENGSRITALPAKPGTVRGYSANIILTEFAFHDDPEAIWQAVFPSVSNPLRGGRKKLRIISTPNGHGNLFHQLWTDKSSCFSRHKTTIHDAVAQGLPIDLAQLRAGLVNPEAWSQEYECQFVDRSCVLLPYALIAQCESPEAAENSCPAELSRLAGEVFVGIDFARKHDLTACWTLERVGQELWTREVLTLERMSTPAQFEALRPRVQRARRVCVDYTGAGIGLGDLLAGEFHAVNHRAAGGKIELCSFTTALKEELFPKLRATFERRKLWIPSSPAIREDLHALHRIVSEHGHISYRATHMADGHSDRCTALALALRASESTPIVAAASSVGQKRPHLRRSQGA